MRGLVALSIALFVALSGCLSGGDAPAEAAAATAAPTDELPPLPEPIETSGTMTLSVDVTSSLLVIPVCTSPAATCERVPFTLERDAKVKIDLAWTLPANDLDLLLLKDGSAEWISGAPPPGTTESITENLEPGEYEILVVGYLAAREEWTLTASFQ